MSYYAKIVDGIVEQVIVADAEVVAPLDGILVETFMDDPAHQYAGIGNGWNGVVFIPRPFEQSTWDIANNAWVTPMEIGIAHNANPIIAADGVDFVLIYFISTPSTDVTVTINGDPLIVTTDARGYGEFELSSDTTGLIVISLDDLTLEVAAI